MLGFVALKGNEGIWIISLWYNEEWWLFIEFIVTTLQR